MPDRVVFCCLHSKPLNIVSAAKLWRVLRFVYRAYTSGLHYVCYSVALSASAYLWLCNTCLCAICREGE